MKKIFPIVLTAITIGSMTAHAQTIFTFGNQKVDKKEFIKFYDENNFDKDKYSQQSIRNYLDMYALYRMKINEAQQLQLDTVPKISSEIQSLKKQLAKSYLVDQSTVENLLKEIENRYNTEIEISHIQITTWGTDTLEAYQEINQAYNDLKSKKLNFDEAAMKYSDDGYSKSYGGYLGYISALDVKYALENAAYNTAVGDISKPVKSELGYHIVKVHNKRPAKGNINVAQILIKPTNPNDPASVEAAKNLSEKLLKELKAGAQFDEYVTIYSEDHLTKDNKGMIEPFSAGTYQLPFEKVAFNIKKNGDYGDIAQTDFGFHIIKLISRSEKPAFATVKSQYLQRLKQDGRVKTAEQILKNEQLKKLNFKENIDNYQALIQWVEADSSKVLDLTKKDINQLNKILFSLNNKDYNQKNFIEFMIDITGGQIYGKKAESISQLYEMYKNTTLDNTHLDVLYKTNTKFKESFDRDRNGVMIFELMNQRVFQKSNEDLDGLQKFYEANREKYTYKAGFDGYILETESEESLKKILPLLKDYNTIRDVIFDFNETADVRVEQINGRYEYHQMPNLKPDNVKPLTPSDIFRTPNGKYSVIIPEKTFPEGTLKPLGEARSQVVNDYQMYLDRAWTQELQEKYPLQIDQKVLNTIKK